MPTAETQQRTAEEARVLEEIRKAQKLGWASVHFTIKRGHVVRSETTHVQDWERGETQSDASDA